MSKQKINAVKYQRSYKKDNYFRMGEFDCKNDDINTLFKKHIDKMHSTTYIFTDETEKIISFVSFCASSIQIKNKNGLFALPAAELKLFGVDRAYQHKNIVINGTELKYSEFTFRWLIAYIQNRIKPMINIEYLILHSVPNQNTLKFYEKMGMKYFTENESVHSSDFSDGCIPMYLEI